MAISRGFARAVSAKPCQQADRLPGRLGHECATPIVPYEPRDLPISASVSTRFGTAAEMHRVRDSPTVTATDSDPVALQHFELVPSHVLAEVLGRESLEVWALRLSGGTVREAATTDPAQVTTREFVFAVPLDVMGNLARKLTEVYERQSGTTL